MPIAWARGIVSAPYRSFAFRRRNKVLLLQATAGAIAALLAVPALAETIRRTKGEASRSPFMSIPPKEAAAESLEGRLVFVDVRERAEYEEFHLPGAVHVPLRDLGGADLQALAGAEHVVPYCLKDFRGFEGARALARRGVPGVAQLEGFGISAWKKDGLPLAGETTGRGDPEALEILRAQLRPKTP
ncbi:MAG: rhodanese-like domain-containing protein [Planctomycetota bacterium]